MTRSLLTLLLFSCAALPGCASFRAVHTRQWAIHGQCLAACRLVEPTVENVLRDGDACVCWAPEHNGWVRVRRVPYYVLPLAGA